VNALLALCFATGIGLLWAGAVCHIPPGKPKPPVWLSGLPLPAPLLVGLMAGGGAAAALIIWALTAIPALAIVAGAGGGYTPIAWTRKRQRRELRERERAWPAALAQLADGLEAGLAFPAAVALAANNGPAALRRELRRFHTRLRSGGLAAALDGLAESQERTADTVVLLLRAGLLDLPAGGLAPMLRELADTLGERLEAREKARSRASSLQVEATILALSPIVLLLLIGSSSPGYLNAYRGTTGTAVALGGGALIFACYLGMRRLGQVPEPRRTREAAR
jgi:tight adherence protein B